MNKISRREAALLIADATHRRRMVETIAQL
jgi:hypothetical protein